MRTLAIGDIHSGLKGLQQVLQRAKVTPEDHLIFLGDYVDAWSDAFETVSFLIQLNSSHNCTFIRGNHDELCLEWMRKGYHNEQWLAHGGQMTKESFLRAGEQNWSAPITFFENLQNYYLSKDNKLFLHAGFTHLRGIEHEYFQKMFYWDRTLWELAQSIHGRLSPSNSDYPQRLTHYQEIYIGHTPVSKTELVAPKNAATVWNVDTGAAFRGALTVIDVDSKEFWQSDPLPSLYPGERGRN